MLTSLIFTFSTKILPWMIKVLGKSKNLIVPVRILDTPVVRPGIKSSGLPILNYSARWVITFDVY